MKYKSSLEKYCELRFDKKYEEANNILEKLVRYAPKGYSHGKVKKLANEVYNVYSKEISIKCLATILNPVDKDIIRLIRKLSNKARKELEKEDKIKRGVLWNY